MKSLPLYLTKVLSSEEATDLCTRLKICDLLNKGLTYREIIKKTGAGAATIARVAKHLQKRTGDVHGAKPQRTVKNLYTFGNYNS